MIVIRKVYLADNLTDDVNGLLLSRKHQFSYFSWKYLVDAVKEVISKIGKTGVIDLTELGHLKHVTTYNKLLAETEPYYIKWSWFRASMVRMIYLARLIDYQTNYKAKRPI